MTKHPEEIKIENMAIVLIEFQKTWTEKGIFHRIIKREYEQRKVLDHTKALASEARSEGIPIIQAPLILDKKSTYYHKTPFPARLFKRFTKGTWKAEFTDGICEDSDLIIEGRYGFDACEGSNLEAMLKKHRIKRVFVAGFTTDHCVKETMNSLIHKGFECYMLADCTAAKNNRVQKKTESEFRIITSKELIKLFRQG